DGTVHQKAFAGQTFDRTVHKGDLTGIEIINRLAEQVWARRIRRLEEHRAIELVRSRDGSRIAGVLMIDVRSGGFVFVQAKAALPCTSRTPPRAACLATAWPWRCARGSSCATWRWCSSIPRGCSRARIRA